MTNQDVSLLASLAQAIVAEPNSAFEFIAMVLEPETPLSPPSEEIKEAVDILSKSLDCRSAKLLTLEDLLDISIELENKGQELAFNLGRSFRWAICVELLKKQRKQNGLDNPDKNLLEACYRGI